jgi:hypothetical protein
MIVLTKKKIEEFEGVTLYEKERSRDKYNLDKTYNNLFVKATNIYLNSDDPNALIKSRNFLIILQYLKKHINYKTALHRLH